MNVIVQAATRVAGLPFRLAIGVGEAGLDLERRTRIAVMKRGETVLFEALDALVARVLEEAVIDRVLERAEAAGIAQRVADRILEDGIAEQIADRVLAGPELERMLEATFKSSLPEELISRLLASEAVWMLVDEIARSPSVTEAIAHQGTGFLDQIAAKARDRSRKADARLQRIARRSGRENAQSGRPAGELLPSPPNPTEDSP